MTSIPTHPALVHIPLGLAFVLPAVAIGFAWALWKGRIQPRSWLMMVLLQAVLLGAGLVALNAGEREGKRVESVVPKTALETHEEYAEQFLWVAGATLIAALLVVVVRRPSATLALSAVTIAGTLLVAAAAIRVGHAGGKLVYVHNAAAAYVSGGKASVDIGKDAPATASSQLTIVDDEAAK